MKRKRITAMLIAALMITSISQRTVPSVQAAKKSVKVGKGMYTVTSEKKKTARFDKVSKKSVTTLSIPATVKIGKKTYKVTAIKENALKGNKKISKLVIGKNVKKINKKAFYGSQLKSITIKSKKITSIGKKAFGKLNSKVVVTLPSMPETKVDSYKKMLKKAGLTGKNQVIKTKTTTDTSAKKPTVIPDPEVRFAIGELKSGVKDRWMNTTTDAEYAVGDSMRFTMWVKTPQEMYGSWSVKETTVKHSIKCSGCGKWFDNSDDHAIHVGQTGHGSGWIYDTKKTIDAWHWTEDKTPCKVVYHATLPEGLTANPDSVEVWRSTNDQISQSDGKYTIQVSGQDVTVTINDIKPSPYRKVTSNGLTSSVIYGIVVKFSAQLNETAATVNTVNASITYNYGQGDKVVAMNPVTIRKQ